MKKQKNIKKKKPKPVKNLTLEMALEFIREAEKMPWPTLDLLREDPMLTFRLKDPPSKRIDLPFIISEVPTPPREALLEEIDKTYGKQNPVAKPNEIE